MSRGVLVSNTPVASIHAKLNFKTMDGGVEGDISDKMRVDS